MTEPSATWLDEHGDPCEQEAAQSVEIQSYDDQGVPDVRVYADLDAEPAIELSDDPADAVVVNPNVADAMAKSTWDLWGHDDEGRYVLATTVPLLVDALGAASAPLQAQRQAVADLMILPAWQAAPPELATAARSWLESTRPSS